MTLQFPIPQFIGEAVRYQGNSWVWDGVGWAIDDTADRIDLATVPAYLGQFVHVLPSVPPLPTFISLSAPDIYGATFILSTVAPLEGIKVYKNGELLVMAGGVGVDGQYVVNRAANRIEFLVPLVVQDVITVGVLTPSDRLAPGRVDVQPIKDLDTDWVTNPANPTTGMVDGVRRTFDLLIDVPGVGQQFATISRNSDLAIFVGGSRQRPGIDYITVGAEVTMTVAPVPGVPFWALWYRPAGGGTGGGIAPPQPPLDGQQSFYGWRPGTGAAWQDARGVAVTVATAAARTALRPDIDIVAGSLVLQADTQELWRWSGVAWVRYLDAGTFTARLGGVSQILRSTTALQRPAAASLLPGQIWVNMTDRVFGFGDAAGDPVVLLPRVAASAGVADAGKVAELNAQGVFDQSFFLAGMRPYGTVDPGSIALTDWNNAHLTGTAPVRAPVGTPNRPPGPDLPFAGQYISMGDANTGVLTAFSPQGNTVYVRARNAGAWAAWVQVNSPGLDISSAMLRANNLNDVASKPAGRTNLEAMFNPRTVYAGDLNLLDETGLYPLGIGVTNGWTNDGTGAGGEATVGDAVLHVETGGSLAYQMGFNVRPAAPAAQPLRIRFMTGPTTWTPWVAILTADEVAAQIAAAIAALPPGTSVAETPPANPEQGQLWFKTVDPVGLFIWFEDGDSGQWVQTGGGGGGGDGGAAATHVGDVPPPNPAQGQLWFRTVEPVGLFVFFQDADSGQWVSTSVGGGPGGGGDSGGGSALGSISYFTSRNAPAGWLVCDGAPVTSANKALRDYLIAAGSPYGVSGLNPRVPDLRGEFIRGFDDGRGVDAGRVFGSAQADEFKSHNHTFQNGGIAGGGFPSLTNGNGSGTPLSFSGGTETRPRNVALLPCINASGSAGITNPPMDIVQGAAGWQVVGDQLIQWGYITLTAPAVPAVVYPKPYKAGTFPSVSVTPFRESGAFSTYQSATENGFIGQLWDGSTGAQLGAGAEFDWIAIGEARDEDKMPKTVPGGDAGGAPPVAAEIVQGAAGWQVVGDVLIQWGAWNNPAGPANITFPRPFKDLGYQLAATVNTTALQPQTSTFTVQTYDRGLTGFWGHVSFVNAGSVGYSGAAATWIAVGEARDEDKMPKELLGNGVPFATLQQARDGLRTDVVLSPAVVRALRDQLLVGAATGGPAITATYVNMLSVPFVAEWERMQALAIAAVSASGAAPMDVGAELRLRDMVAGTDLKVVFGGESPPSGLGLAIRFPLAITYTELVVGRAYELQLWMRRLGGSTATTTPRDLSIDGRVFW